ncbi:MAG: hypothetical protein CVV41_04275 [Candidatus Riflebacteria bacterium HGW-Riflebacteria-1]|jgi:nucleoredoxin|nr:MAG: hypothetical protein CVV41_04275 [Candidatus Riflebacteria bacterium HGW-Riflebacteria-1]
MKFKSRALHALLALFILVFSPVFSAGENPAGYLEQAFPDGLIDADQQEYALESLEGKIVGLYFSASWCRGCAAFSRILVPFRDKHSDVFEVVMVGFDNNSTDMHAYMKDYGMAWAAIPYDSSARLAMKEHFAVSEIPQMIIVTSEGRVLTKDGYQQVQLMGDEALAHWQKLSGAADSAE